MKSYFLVEEFSVKTLNEYWRKGRINLDATYQRNEVWTEKRKQLLIDTLVRGLPCGVITLFKYFDEVKQKEIYEVIDGKQRLTTINSYLDSNFTLPESIDSDKTIALDMSDEASVSPNDSDEDEALAIKVGQASRQKYINKLWSDLNEDEQDAFHDIKIAAFVVTSKQRDLAVDVFIRMNQNTVGLSPQEIRNAVFYNSALLKVAAIIADAQTPGLAKDQPIESIWWVSSGLITKQNYPRMSDIEFVLEILSMALHDNSPQHRRDSLDSDCEMYANPKGNSLAILKQAEKTVTDCFKKITAIFPQGFHAASQLLKGSRLQNDAYALLAALMKYEKSYAAIKSHSADYAKAIVKLKEASISYLTALRSANNVSLTEVDDKYQFKLKDQSGKPLEDEFATLAKRYAQTFTGGQVNGQKQREIRRDIWFRVLCGVSPMNASNRNFSTLQRHLIWELKPHLCPRCNQEVTDRNYWDAGHIKPFSEGGETSISNGRVEHVHCNRAAGAN